MWPFTRRHRQQIVTETWRPGDLAECMVDRWKTMVARQPRLGSRAIAIRVYHGPVGIALELVGYGWRWDASAFRKIVTIPGPDDCASVGEPELITPASAAGSLGPPVGR